MSKQDKSCVTTDRVDYITARSLNPPFKEIDHLHLNCFGRFSGTTPLFKTLYVYAPMEQSPEIHCKVSACVNFPGDYCTMNLPKNFTQRTDSHDLTVPDIFIHFYICENSITSGLEDSSKGASSGGKEKLDTYLDSYLLHTESVCRRWN